MSSPRHSDPLRNALLSFAALLVVSLAVYGSVWAIDFWAAPDHPGPIDFARDQSIDDVLSGVSEVTVAVLGIAITVVAIIVELAANRYTPRISEMFIRDPVNVGVMGFFTITTILTFWGTLSLHGPSHPTALVLAMMFFISVSLLAILPYFAYVFDFLTPTQVINRIKRNAVKALTRLQAGGGDLDLMQSRVLEGTEQLGELALNGIDNHDKAISISALEALEAVAAASIKDKKSMPDTWHDTSGVVKGDHDFVAFHESILYTLQARQTWVEMKILRQYQAVFGAALNKMPDVAHMVSIHTRHIAATAHRDNDREVLALAVRFMNTYLRAAINRKDVRTAYNLYNEYRGLLEDVMTEHDRELVIELAEYFKFYGQLSFQRDLAFILETAAYDMCTLLEKALERKMSFHDEILDIFLQLDREPDQATATQQEASLRGVRKAQVKLATYYLVHNEEARARRIFEDMRTESPDRLASIREELSLITEPEYWEVSDRGINFDWLPPEQRAQLDVFFDWFKAAETAVVP